MKWTDAEAIEIGSIAWSYARLREGFQKFEIDLDGATNLIGKQIALESMLRRVGDYVENVPPELNSRMGKNFELYLDMVTMSCKKVYREVTGAGLRLRWTYVSPPMNLEAVFPWIDPSQEEPELQTSPNF